MRRHRLGHISGLLALGMLEPWVRGPAAQPDDGMHLPSSAARGMGDERIGAHFCSSVQMRV